MIRNMLEYFNVCLLDFCIIHILTSTTVTIECISWLIKVTDQFVTYFFAASIIGVNDGVKQVSV